MNIDEEFNNIIKILIVGDFSVGKTNFILQFVENKFLETTPTITSCDIKSTILKTRTSKLKLQFWDTCGQERFCSISQSLYSKVDGIILMYDITNYSSFSNLQSWIDNINENCGKSNIIIIGNKTDLSKYRCVSQTKAFSFAEEHHLKHKEVSAKTGFNIKETIHELIEIILQRTDTSFLGLSLNYSVDNNKHSCCNKIEM